MPYQFDGTCLQVIVLSEVVQVFVADHGLVQQSAAMCFRHDRTDPIERDAEYEVVLRRKIRNQNGEGKTP